MSLRSEKMADGSAEAMLGPNPFVGFSARDIVREAIRVTKLVTAQPRLTVHALNHFSKELAAIMRDESKLAPAARDKRFSYPAWKDDPRYRKWLQSFIALEQSIAEWMRQQDLPTHSRARLEFMISLLTDAIAPSNFPWQPEAIQRFKESGGHSALDGVKHLLRDLRDNKGMPAQIDKSQFKVGGNLANTPGAVVFRSEVFELIQYKPTTAKVHQAPVLFVPPQINKFYIFDLTPEKSVVKAVLDQGLQAFVISWRNPNARHAEWGLAEYAAAIDTAISAICHLTDATRVNLVGACAGGLTVAAYVAARAAAADQRVNTLTLMVSVIDTQAVGETTMGLFATPRAIKLAKKKSADKGVLDGQSMSNAFAWLRPNDLIWNYWVNNVLLGNKTPAFDLLYWNNDNTRLPARLHAEFMDMLLSGSITEPGKLRLNGLPVDLGRISCDSYILGGTTDHITPWRGCYRSTQLFGGKKTFVLSNAGHMQSILNPPGNKKSEFWTLGTLSPDPDAWRETATHQQGSWWPNWHAWLQERSGALRDAPAQLGSADYLPLADAPGTYVAD
jgi:polyhydroxyalkanoate synthase subunit PhaC